MLNLHESNLMFKHSKIVKMELTSLKVTGEQNNPFSEEALNSMKVVQQSEKLEDILIGPS